MPAEIGQITGNTAPEEASVTSARICVHPADGLAHVAIAERIPGGVAAAVFAYDHAHIDRDHAMGQCRLFNAHWSGEARLRRMASWARA